MKSKHSKINVQYPSLDRVIQQLSLVPSSLWMVFLTFRDPAAWRSMFQHKWVFVVLVILTFILFSDLYDMAFPKTETENSSISIKADSLSNNSVSISINGDSLDVVDVRNKVVDTDSERQLENEIVANVEDAIEADVEEEPGEGLDVLTESGISFFSITIFTVISFFIGRYVLGKLTGVALENDFKTFMGSQWRTFAMSVYGFVLKTMWLTLLTVALSIGHLSYFKPFLKGIVIAYLLGVIVVDGYMESKGWEKAESEKLARTVWPITLATGVLFQGLIQIPFLGILFAPVLATVFSVILLYQWEQMYPFPVKGRENDAAAALKT